MKKGFTILEVSILFVIFLIVAFLVAPLSLDDTIQAKNTSRWRAVQQDFSNIVYSIENLMTDEDKNFNEAINIILDRETKGHVQNYKISYLNGSTPEKLHTFDNLKNTYSNAVIGIKIYNNGNDEIEGLLMYDVNGPNGPNIWGKDVFGYNIYDNEFKPFCKTESLTSQKRDCSKGGTGICCSNYYLIGGNFD